MGFMKAMQRQQAAPVQAHSMACHATGCRLIGSASTAGGHFLCFVHTQVSNPHDWPHVTAQISEFGWLSDLIGDLQRLYNAGRFEDARKMARSFWQGQDESLIPSRDEELHFDAYLTRLRGEMAWRTGANKRRPEPWIAPRPRPGGNLTAQIA